MLVTTEGHSGYRFGEYLLDLDRRALLRDGEELPLRPKAFDVLLVLVENAGTVVTREELLERVWPDTLVTDVSLSQCLSDIRHALADPGHHRVRTVPKRGVILEAEVEKVAPGPGADRPADARRRPPAWIGAVVLLGLAGVVLWQLQAGRNLPQPAAPAVETSPAPSIAVMAFDDLSPGADHQWFGDGIAEEILNRLAQVPGLTVIARTSSFAFRGSNENIRTIAERLDVTHVLEGSVRLDGELVRVTAQLVDADTEAHLWSQAFDRTLDDVFGVQEDIARGVANRLQLDLLDDAEQVAQETDPEAWAAYLRGQFAWNRRAEGDVARAEQAFREALDLDPGLARAWAGISGVHMLRIYEGTIEYETGITLMGEAAGNALRLAPHDPVVLSRAARYEQWSGNPDRAEALWEAALERDPDDVLTLSMLAGQATNRGEYDRGLALSQRAARLDPLNTSTQIAYAVDLYLVGRLQESERVFLQIDELFPNVRELTASRLGPVQVLLEKPGDALETVVDLPDGPGSLMVRAMAHLSMGDEEAAHTAMEGLAREDSVHAAVALAEVNGWRGDSEAAMKWLNTALERMTPDEAWSDGWDHVSWAKISPLLRLLEGRPDHAEWVEAVDQHAPSRLIARRAENNRNLPTDR